MTPMSGPAAPAQGRRRPLLRLALLAALLAGGAMGALAQSGPPIPSQPVYPQPPQSYPAPQPSYPGPQAYPQPSPQASPQRELSPQEIRCLQREQELANEWTTRTGSDRADQLSQIDEEIRKQDRIFQGTQAAMERGSCYESVFIFGKALVRSPKCLRMNDTVEEARRQLARPQQQRQALSNPGTARRRQDELIDALARAGCGRQYQQDARRRDSGGGFFSNFFGGQDDYPRRNLETSRIESFATYRTLCVRTCDGFYFPISYSTLPTQFNNDIAACQAQCAAPAELFVHRNPGEEAEQMVSANGVTAYASTPNAFRFRKEYVKGCSCKVTEYNPAEIETYNQKAEAEGKIKGVTPAPRVAQDKAPQPLKRPQ
ncbi:MAG: DUF2865 domain-containing protein [Pseudomonadota bacterium]|nr:DUF2865 domain-containing protein [Pseudomonadota bacterium]